MTKNSVLEDVTKLATNAAAVVLENAKGAFDSVKDKAKGAAGRIDLVSREEFDVVRELAQSALQRIDELNKRIEELEGKNKSK
jgi:BMFP domain-containing protein YqiC